MTYHLLDTTVLIAHLRDDAAVAHHLRSLLADGDGLAVSAVSIAELELGLLPKERRRTDQLVDRLRFLPTTKEAARRAGRYQASFRRKGITLHTPDALIAGTARAHGARVLTDNVAHFPMRDIRVSAPPH